MTVSKQEFDAFKLEVNTRFDRMESDNKSAFAIIHQYMDRIEQHMESIERRLDKMDQRLDKMDERLDKMDERLDKMDQRLDKMDERLDKMDQRLDSLEKKVDRLEVRLASLSGEVNDMRLSFGARFDVVSGQLRLLDQGQLRTEDRLSRLHRRVHAVEDEAC